ncbi:spore germination protein [Oceanobacillus salinisoli]|uniref:spore germination protein n=1 Tax=Oceanobacillus salinisoli TaxID=2678611 RepID=UPI0012E138E1|nr:spore germination protein [Oceanobacillus salinisoli]
MPAIVGAVKVITVSTSSIFNIGDVYSIAPRSTAKTYAGGGSFNTGRGIQIRLTNSKTQVTDTDKIDQPVH